MKNKKVYIVTGAVIITVVLAVLAFGFINSYFGWYANRPWESRVGTGTIEESKKRGVFIKELHYKIDSFSRRIPNFHVYIERGFHYSHNSTEETDTSLNSAYPYQMNYTYYNTGEIGIILRKSELEKFDSSNSTHGYLKYPKLNDTVTADIIGENIHSGIIKIWQ